jgi:hypothetical protein
MKEVCMRCGSELNQAAIPQKAMQLITNGLCSVCTSEVFKQSGGSTLKKFLNAIDSPILLMQGNPRQVVTANQKACALFEKDLSKIEQHRGGQVFDCIHSFTEEGCGKDINCNNCKIKNAVVETFSTGASFKGVSTVLEIKKNEIIAFDMQVTTERVGDYALLRIDRFEKRSKRIDQSLDSTAAGG